MESFNTIVNSYKPVTILAKLSIFDFVGDLATPPRITTRDL